MTVAAHIAGVAAAAHQETQQETQQVSARGGITYLEAGDEAATPILFLHGIGGAARAFARQLGAFRRALPRRSPGTCRASRARRRCRW